MANIRSELLRISFYLVLLICIHFGDANLKPQETNLHSFDIELLKRSLFPTNIPSEIYSKNLSPKNSECLLEIEEIFKGLFHSEPWAMRIVDAWGKVPSSVLEGNLFELGGFSECFHIERNNSHYPSKYCMGRLELDGILNSKTQPFNLDDVFFHGNMINKNKPQIIPRFQLKSGTALTFGMCIPAVCSLDFVHDFLTMTNSDKFPLKLSENTCQLEENASELRTLDWVTIGLLTFVLILMVLSTVYDLFCTMYDCQKTEALLAFSVYSNGIKVLSYKVVNSPDMMQCLHGIRAITTQWIVLGHTFMMVPDLPMRNLAQLPQFLAQYHSMFILSASIAVDTFFVLSGLLVSINMLKHFDKTKGRINLPLIYFHRYIRLTPLLAISILFSMTLLRFLGNGPYFPSTIDLWTKQCDTYWWSTLLYVQNYVNPSDICFGHSWYLSVDTQLFFISPLIVYLIYRFKTKALLAMSVLVLGCVGCTLALYLKYEIGGIGDPEGEKIYNYTHTRFSPWLVGVIAGHLLFVTRGRTIRIPRIFNLFSWAISLAIMAAVIFANYPLMQLNEEHTPLEHGLYNALSRVGWAIALCYIIFACVHNSGGPVNKFLAHPLWQPVSRLCYSIYLLHIPVLLLTSATLKAPQYFTEFMIFHKFIGNYILTVFVSLVATLAFESPVVILEKILFGPKKKLDSAPKTGS